MRAPTTPKRWLKTTVAALNSAHRTGAIGHKPSFVLVTMQTSGWQLPPRKRPSFICHVEGYGGGWSERLKPGRTYVCFQTNRSFIDLSTALPSSLLLSLLLDSNISRWVKARGTTGTETLMSSNAIFREAMEAAHHIADPEPPWQAVLQGAAKLVGADSGRCGRASHFDVPVAYIVAISICFDA